MSDISAPDLRPEAEIELQFPVEVDGVTYKALTMRRPKTKDGLAASKFRGNDAERGIFLLARLCNVAPNVIEELDEIDAMALDAQLRAFQGR